MAGQSGRFIGRISSFVAAGGFFAAAIIVGLIPYSEGGYSGLCPSALQGMFGGMSSGQSLVNFFSGGRCTTYVSTMTTIMFVLFALAVVALVAAILLRRRKAAAAAGYPYPPVGQDQMPYQGPAAPGAPAQPGYAPMTGTTPGDPAAGAWSAPKAVGQGSGSFDTKLLLVGLAAVAGVVLISFLVDFLSFLPGILELVLWTAVGLTVIWQLKRRAAGTDPVKLAAAEAWNPAVVARGAVAAGRHRLENHRAQRREAERTAHAFAPAPQNHDAPFDAEPQYTNHSEPDVR
jgi:hypothetical protein